MGSGEVPTDALIFLYSSKRLCSRPAWRLAFPLSVDSRPPPPIVTCAGRKEDSFFSLWRADDDVNGYLLCNFVCTERGQDIANLKHIRSVTVHHLRRAAH